MRDTLFCVGVLLLACGPSSPPADGDAAPGDLSVSDGSRPGTVLYPIDEIGRLDPSEVVVLSDEIHPAGTRHVREIAFGIVEQGFPSAATRFGVSGRLFVETDAEGAPLGDMSSVALSIRAVSSRAPDPDGKTIECALKTGHVCVVAGENLLSPGRLDPPYPNEATSPQMPISDSNAFQLNLLSEYRRGTDIEGRDIRAAGLERLVVGQIARAGMRLITATQRIVVRLGLTATEPDRFVVTGHSKWGGAAAQMIAFDPRVVGGLVAGWPLDWQNWLDLSIERWQSRFDIDIVRSLCTNPADPCLWQDTQEFSDFFDSTSADPLQCGDHVCPGVGEDWLRQFDVKHLSVAGAFFGKELAAVRNGREAHPVDTESALVAGANGPDAFLFLPNAGHTFDSESHNAMWRHWIRHTLDEVPTLRLSLPTVNFESREVRSEVVGGVLSRARFFVRPSVDDTFGGADAFPVYQDACAAASSCRVWQELTAAEGATLVATLPSVREDFAVVAIGYFDDGSGDEVLLSSPVAILRAR